MKHLTDNQILLLAKKLYAQERLTAGEGELLAHCAFCSECYDMLQVVSALLEVTDHMDTVLDMPEEEQMHDAVIQVVIMDARAIMEQLHARTEEMEFYAPLPSFKRGSENGRTRTVRLENNESNITYDPATKTLYITLCSSDGRMPRASLKCEDRVVPIEFVEYDGLFAAELHGLENGEYQIVIG